MHGAWQVHMHGQDRTGLGLYNRGRRLVFFRAVVLSCVPSRVQAVSVNAGLNVQQHTGQRTVAREGTPK